MTAATALVRALALIAFLGCGGRSERQQPDSARGIESFDESALHPRVPRARVVTSDGLAEPSAIGLVGSYLVVADRTGADSMVKVFTATKGKEVYAGGRLGAGPGEFREVWSVRPALSSSVEHPAADLYDVLLRRITRIDLGPDGLGVAAKDRPLLTLQPEASLTDAAWVDTDSLVALGFFRTGRVGLFDSKGRQVGVFGRVPGDEERVPAPVLQHAYQSSMALKPDRSLIVAANRHAGRLEILTKSGQLVKEVRGPFYFTPTYTVAKGLDSAKTPVFSSGDDLRFGYIAVTATDSRIYALFSGRVRKAFPGEANYGQFVHEFDWQGRFVQSYDLGQPVYCIVVDANGSLLYAARHNPEPAILAYTLASDR